MSESKRSWPVLRLYRLSIAFTPWADCALGYYAAHGGGYPLPPHWRFWAACTASTAAFCFGTSLNDLLDLDKDRILAPERPLPAREISRRKAWTASLAMLALSLAMAAAAGRATLLAMGGVLVSILLYNLYSRRNDWTGVATLGLIRSLDLFVGASLVHTPIVSWCDLDKGPVPLWIILLLYGGYAMALSVFALGERGQRGLDLRWPAAMALGFSSVPLFRYPQTSAFWPALAVWALLALPVFLFFRQPQKRPESLTGHFVSGYFLQAAILLSSGPLHLTAILVIFYFLSRLLSRWFPPG